MLVRSLDLEETRRAVFGLRKWAYVLKLLVVVDIFDGATCWVWVKSSDCQPDARVVFVVDIFDGAMCWVRVKSSDYQPDARVVFVQVLEHEHTAMFISKIIKIQIQEKCLRMKPHQAPPSHS